MSHQAHHRLGRVELLGHERLGAGRRRRWHLHHSAATGPSGGPCAAVLTAAAAVVVVLVLVVGVGIGAGAIAASSLPAAAVSVTGRGAIAVPAAPSAPISAVSTVAAAAAAAAVFPTGAAHRAHSPVTLVLVHQVGIVRIGVATETGTATWK